MEWNGVPQHSAPGLTEQVLSQCQEMKKEADGQGHGGSWQLHGHRVPCLEDRGEAGKEAPGTATPQPHLGPESQERAGPMAWTVEEQTFRTAARAGTRSHQVMAQKMRPPPANRGSGQRYGTDSFQETEQLWQLKVTFASR